MGNILNAIGVAEQIRPEVLAFAALMELKLRENDDKPGWKGLRDKADRYMDESSSALLERIEDEAQELKALLTHSGDYSFDSRRIASLKVMDECADVANFAMMIADIVGVDGYLPHRIPALVDELQETAGGRAKEVRVIRRRRRHSEQGKGETQTCIDCRRDLPFGNFGFGDFSRICDECADKWKDGE